MKKKIVASLILASAIFVGVAFAGDAAAPAPKIDTGDTAWVLVSAALVLLMTPGLALFYGGMVRRKNVLGTMKQSFVAIPIVSIQWVLIGYSLAFGPDVGHFIGNLSWFGLNTVGLSPNADYAPTIPHQAFMIFQMMFAVITPAVVSGAFAERMKFTAFVAFLLLWTTLVYDPIAHWVWGTGGWIRALGGLDFAGGFVVEINSGVSALAAAIVIGRRRGWPHEPMMPHNLTLMLLGAGLLWFGWFGFNAGSAAASGTVATAAFVSTHIATAAAAMAWMIVEWWHRGKPTLLGAASGAVAGLVAITPAAGFVGPLPSLLLGGVAGLVCYAAVVLKNRLGYDDSLDAFGVHGIGGTWGAVATGIFASVAVNAGGANGLLYGNPNLALIQLGCVAATWAYSFFMTFTIMKVLDAVIGVRVDGDEEEQGLDLTQHGENAYTA
ncbi:MAG: ammonium transporter [Nitrospinae bacterium]|nr:ammonium transporter [Nitrospinota bacterium]